MGLGIDVGTSQTVICASDRGVVLREPSVIAVRRGSRRVLACGAKAQAMLGRAPDSIRVIRPIRKGVISDYEYAEAMIRHFVRRVCTYKVLKPNTGVTLPSTVTEVEERSMIEAVSAASVRRVMLVEKSVAALIGTGEDITQPHGCMVADFGGGTTDITVMSLSGIAASRSVRIGGDDLDDAIVRYVRGKYNHVIGLPTAERIKNTIGGVATRPGNPVMEVKGRDAHTGLPAIREVTAEDVTLAMEETIDRMLTTLRLTLERTLPDLAGDVMRDGMMLTGGVSQLYGLGERLEQQTGIPCRMAKDPIDCGAIGALEALGKRRLLAHSVYNVSQFNRPDELWG